MRPTTWPYSRIFADQPEAPTCAAARSPRVAWRAARRLRDIARDALPPVRTNLALTLPVLIGPIVASEGNGGRLGNYADPTAATAVGRCAFHWQRAEPTSRPYAFPRGQRGSFVPGRTALIAHVHGYPSDLWGR